MNKEQDQDQDQDCFLLFCFELMDKIFGHNEEGEFICSGSKQAKTNLGLADRLCQQSILFESSFPRQSIVMTKKKNSDGKRNSICIHRAFNRKTNCLVFVDSFVKCIHTLCYTVKSIIIS